MTTTRTSTCLTTKTAEAKAAAGLETNNTSRASGSIFSLSFYFTDDYFFDRNRRLSTISTSTSGSNGIGRQTVERLKRLTSLLRVSMFFLSFFASFY